MTDVLVPNLDYSIYIDEKEVYNNELSRTFKEIPTEYKYNDKDNDVKFVFKGLFKPYKSGKYMFKINGVSNYNIQFDNNPSVFIKDKIYPIHIVAIKKSNVDFAFTIYEKIKHQQIINSKTVNTFKKGEKYVVNEKIYVNNNLYTNIYSSFKNFKNHEFINIQQLENGIVTVDFSHLGNSANIYLNIKYNGKNKLELKPPPDEGYDSIIIKSNTIVKGLMYELKTNVKKINRNSIELENGSICIFHLDRIDYPLHLYWIHETDAKWNFDLNKVYYKNNSI